MGEGSAKNGQFANWLPIVDAFRTFLLDPPIQLEWMLRSISELLPGTF